MASNKDELVLNGRLHRRDGDGLYQAVPLSMDEARDWKKNTPPRISMDFDTGKAYMAVEPDRMLDYLDRSVSEGAVIVRAYPAGDAYAVKAPRRLVQAGEDIAIPQKDGDGSRRFRNVDAGSYIDTTDPTDMRAVAEGDVGRAYTICDRYVLGQEGRNTRYLNFEAGTVCRDGSIAGASASVPVNVLFNENDTAGEAVPLEDVSIPVTKPDGSSGTLSFQCLENVVVGHDDLSETRLDPALERARMLEARAADEAIRAGYGSSGGPEGLLARLKAESPYYEAEGRMPAVSPKMRDLMDKVRSGDEGRGDLQAQDGGHGLPL